jgi:hypothetical protein
MVQAFTSWLFAFVTPYMYNVGAGSGNLGAKTAFVYMGSSIVLLLVAFFYIPETRRLSTEELDWLYENSVPPRKFGAARVQAGNGGRERATVDEKALEEKDDEGRQWSEKTAA